MWAIGIYHPLIWPEVALKQFPDSVAMDAVHAAKDIPDKFARVLTHVAKDVVALNSYLGPKAYHFKQDQRSKAEALD